MRITQEDIFELAAKIGEQDDYAQMKIKEALLVVAGMTDSSGDLVCEPGEGHTWGRVAGIHGQYGRGIAEFVKWKEIKEIESLKRLAEVMYGRKGVVYSGGFPMEPC